MGIKQIRIDLENCYGIKALQSSFDFSDASAYAIYAPNGAMKTSFAQTFRDLSEGRSSRDVIFPSRDSKRQILDDTGNELPAESVLVVSPYDKDFGFTDKTATLLVNSKLKKEYADLQADVDQSKKALLRALKQQSGSKKNVEEEVSLTFRRFRNWCGWPRRPGRGRALRDGSRSRCGSARGCDSRSRGA